MEYTTESLLQIKYKKGLYTSNKRTTILVENILFPNFRVTRLNHLLQSVCSITVTVFINSCDGHSGVTWTKRHYNYYHYDVHCAMFTCSFGRQPTKMFPTERIFPSRTTIPTVVIKCFSNKDVWSFSTKDVGRFSTKDVGSVSTRDIN